MRKLAEGGQTEPEALWATFRAVLERRGYRVVELPDGDFQTTVHLDLSTGRMVGATEALHPFQDATSSVQEAVFDAVQRVGKQASSEAAAAIQRALAASDHVEAAQVLVGDNGAVLLGPAPDVLEQAKKIDTNQLAPELAVALVRQRVGLAGASNDFGPQTAADLAYLRSHAWASFDERQRFAITIAEGCAAAAAGRTEHAWAIWKDVAVGSVAPELASLRGSAWAQMAKLVPLSDPEAVTVAQRGTDEFLQAGEHVNAARMALRHAKCVLSRDASRAIQIVDEALSWFGGETIAERDVRAGLLHSRAVALLKIRRLEEAADAALAAAELRGPLHGVDGERASSLMTAVIALRALGRSEEAERREREADAIIATCADPGVRLDRAVAQLAQDFEPSRAEELRAEAQRLGASRTEAILMVLLASHGTAPHAERLDQLERALHVLRTHGAGDEDIDVVNSAIAVELQKAEPARALAVWRGILSNDPLNLHARQSIAALLFQLEHWRDAADFLRADRERFGDSPGVLYGEGRALLADGRPAEAVHPLNRALSLCREEDPMKPLVDGLLRMALDRCAGQPAPPPVAPTKPVISAGRS